MEFRENEQLIAWLSLARDNRFSIGQKHRLLTELGATAIYQSAYQDLCALLGIRVEYQKNKKFLAALEKGLTQDLAWLEKPDNYLVCWGDDNYPELLTQISDPPVCFFARGKLSLLAEPKVSIVGSRRPTPAGVKITQTIANNLASLGVVVTSGMALGIDGKAHQAALDIGEPTIAVMGCGLDIISPARHRTMFDQISKNGLVMSEYPIAYPASKYTFPQRNRIVSGLSYGVVIVEAADKSGTLITARLAMEQNREVFVVPGSPLNPQYVGSHRLIRQGATLVAAIDDVLEELVEPLQSVLNQADFMSSGSSREGNDDEDCINYPLLTHINYEPTTINEIILSSGLTVGEVSSMLLILEVEGLVAMTRDGSYLRVC